MLDAALLPLTNDEARIRPMRSQDAAAYAAGTKDPEVQAHAHLPASEYSTESVQALITDVIDPGLAQGDLAILTIADPATDAFAGSLVLFDVTDHSAEVGFWVHPDFRGTGKSRAALALAGDFARASRLDRLTARTSTANAASQAVLAAAGFEHVDSGWDTAPSGHRIETLHYNQMIDGQLPVPVITERLELRLHSPHDAEWLHHTYSHSDVARFLLEDPWTASDATEQLDKRLARVGLDAPDGALSLVITLGGDPIGAVELWLTDRAHRVAEIGWVLDPQYSGQGYGREAVQAVLDLAFDRYRLHRVAAQMDARNDASARLAAGVGMQREAHLRQDWWSKGEWTDTLIFAILAADR